MMHGRIARPGAAPPSSRYEGHRGLDPVASALVLLITAGLLFLLTAYRGQPEAKRVEHRIEVVNLDIAPPPPPPPPPATPPPPRTPPPVAAFVPPPLVPIPSPSAPPVQAQPDPVPAEPVASPEPAKASAALVSARPVSAGDLSASMIHAPPPRYPRESRRLREQGTVVLSVLLASDGTVADIGVAKSSGHRRLDDAALAAVRKWRWRPTMRQGVAVQVRGSVEIPFVLTG
ncbi:energy transducer TonB [Sphingopyxis sp. PET50]|uniref:energy transducer TonB n=1 Tax=Sphingopyxis sp. PET50 TaxID=2976533 RepID=UPI0021AEA580|nr:energy transducer TonB [Sphingopyxis sp. PET50]